MCRGGKIESVHEGIQTKMKITQQFHKSQRFNHTLRNKLTPAMIVLRELRDKRVVNSKLIDRALHDLQVIVRFLGQRKLSKR